MEKVIVVVTTYNLEKYISQALDSVLAQITNFDFKILIGDDASSDKTPVIIKSYKEKFPDKIEIKFSKKNLGSLKNSNRLFDGLNCEYFSFLDGDDFWEDNYRLQKQVDFLDSHPEFMMCAGNTQYIRDGEKAEFLLKPTELDKSYTFDDFINNKMPFFHVSSILLRNVIYINGLPKCYKYAEDTFENCALRGEDFRRLSHLEKGPLYAMPDLFSYYRIHNGGIWSGATELKRSIECAISYNFYRKYYKNTSYFNFFNKEFCNLYSSLIGILLKNYNLINEYKLSEKDSFLFVNFLQDIAEQQIPFDNTTPFNINIYRENKNISVFHKCIRKIKKILKGY